MATKEATEATRKTTLTIFLCNGNSFLDKLGVGNTNVIHIVDKSGKGTSELSERVGSNPVCVIMESSLVGGVFWAFQEMRRGNNSGHELDHRHDNIYNELKTTRRV